MECSPEEFNAHMDEEHLEIVDHITQLEEIARQHFENEAKLLELRSPVSDHQNDLALETHKKSHQKLLEAIEGIANEFRDHIRLEEWYQVQNKTKT
jgi:hemerythrin